MIARHHQEAVIVAIDKFSKLGNRYAVSDLKKKLKFGAP